MTPVAPHGRICRDCKWFTPPLCKRYPPQFVLWPSDNQPPVIYMPAPTSPAVASTDWCGEWASDWKASPKE